MGFAWLWLVDQHDLVTEPFIMLVRRTHRHRGPLGTARQCPIERTGTAGGFLPRRRDARAEVAALIDAALTRFGQVDCVFNNAGASAPGEIDTITLDRAANANSPVPDRLD
jgi:NAD(P)-dependent dehydrogenase (short-subunit alcohol dehydrogenase family)